MNDFKYVSEEYNLNHTKNYRLSIQLNQDGFSVLIAKEKKKILKIFHKAGMNQPAVIKELKDNSFLQEITKLKFQKAIILINNRAFSIVPEAFFDYHTMLSFFKLEHNISDTDAIQTSTPELENIELIFSYPEYSSIIRLFVNSPEIAHVGEPLLEYIKRKTITQNTIILYQGGKVLHILSFIQGKLNIYNAFDISTKDDFLYYSYSFVKKIYDKIGRVQLFYSGTINENDIHSSHLNGYIEEPKCLPNEMPFEMAGFEFENYFTNLLISANCEL